VADLVGAAVLRLAHRIRSSRSLQVLEEIRDEPFATQPEAARRQLHRLQRLLRHCAAHVPYYREVFAQHSVMPEDIRSFRDFERVPVLTKADVAEHGESLIAENVPRERLLAHHSGGSTGVPLRFYRDASYVAASEAGTYRNLLQCGWTPGEMIAFFWGWNERLSAMRPLEFRARQFVRRMYQFDPFRSGDTDMWNWWRDWRIIRPRAALGYASTIARYARFLHERGLRPRPLRGVFTTAEKLFPPQRDIIEAVFGCRVFDCYGSSEVQNIATECRLGRMHVNADFAVVELDEPADPDNQGPLLVTSLRNFAMPFLRYRNEDRGGLSDAACGCGSGFPLMSLNVARVSDNFPLPNGRVVHGEFFTHLLYGSSGVDSFQFHQIAGDRIVLRYVPSDNGDPQPSLRRAVDEVEALAPGLIRVEVEAVDTIPLSSAGKHRFTRSELVQ
jgi:phenylacetate-CoA ligase